MNLYPRRWNENLTSLYSIVDLHSHMGIGPSPSLSGTSGGGSHYGLILPWLRSLDGLNTHDDAYKLSISGGITTALVVPGSGNAIGEHNGSYILMK